MMRLGKKSFLMNDLGMPSFEFQKNHKYFAQVAGSVEKHAADELRALGAEVVSVISRGLRFTCNTETLYHVIYCSRLVQRILAPLFSFQCHSEKYLYHTVRNNCDWTSLIKLDQCFSIITNVMSSKINNSLYAGQVMKDAICDQFKQIYQRRPNFQPRDGDVVLSLYINDNWATIAFDLTGTSMHKRGYRTAGHDAPLQETLAATVIRLTDWVKNKPAQNLPLYDIMCGSGTLLAEALMQVCCIPAGYLRNYAYLWNTPYFQEQTWLSMKKKVDSQIIPLVPDSIMGSDLSPECVEITRQNLKKIPFGEKIKVSVSPFQELPKIPQRVIVTNPPYGIRIGVKNNIPKLYQELGDFLKQKCPQSEAYILCGKAELVPELRLRAHWKKSLKNGDLETKLVKIKIK